jgi:osmotically-inducible protein OsmY
VDARAAVIVIEEAVRRVVERHAAPCREQVHVSLDGGRVHLSGPVASGEDRRAILAALRALPGVDAIDEQLIVADFPGSPVA